MIIHLGRKLGFCKIEDWYKVSRENISENGGSGLLNFYKNSTLAAVMTNFHEKKFEWKEWKFECLPFSWWKNKENRLKYMTYHLVTHTLFTRHHTC